MIAVLSATEHDYYAMPLPFAVYSWIKIGCTCIVFIPKGDNPKLELVKKYFSAYVSYYEFDCDERRIPTYSQVSRLLGAATENVEDVDVLVTGDSDLCVFGDYFEQLKDGRIHIVGSDLTPDEQYPMCFAAMPAKKWKDVYGLNGKTYQEKLEEIINPIQSTNLRGTAWCLDQFLLKKHLDESGETIIKHRRSNGENQFATKRADRDGWFFNPDDIIDAHLPRPLTDDENFNKVYELFKYKYPNDDLSWMKEYQEQYKKLL